ncbi:MAG: 3-oxo-tetronate kinase [uncultured Paraburkholderia sp.]|nr:MAG: 3-oxo-tetronate kinase [uncultured Paraburkholderia sp.]
MTATTQRTLLGCIADDFTGATDLTNMLVRGGMRTVQTIGVPERDETLQANASADAIVVALKSRTIPAADAVAQSLAALDWLRAQGCRQFVFKYCSTFDSTDAGNIGPVTDALLDALSAGKNANDEASAFTIACPAFPENGRTIFRGHLFVGDTLLNESGMENHPLTPMRDANLVRVLQRQTPSQVGLVRYDAVAQGVNAVRESFDALRRDGVRKFVVAGGETSGAVVQALDVRSLRIGAQIDPGVPATATTGAPPLALKSGNFGATDFFEKALRHLEGGVQ